jgi:glycosyltransferase involved in cell wall biosynthesis
MFLADMAHVLRSRGHLCEFFFFRRGPMESHLPPGCEAHFGDLADCLRLISDGGFDVVHANSMDWHDGISAVRGVGPRLVTTAHGVVVTGWTSANCDALVTCSKWLADEYDGITDLTPQTVLNGVDLSKFKPGGEGRAGAKPIIAWVGRGVDEVKGIDRFAAIAPTLHRAGFRLWLAEPHGPDEVEEVFPGIKGLLSSLVSSWRAMAREEMPSFYQEVAASGGCVVSTSRTEGLPMSLLEAQACGCPVIGPNVRGVNECVDPSRGGILYPPEAAPEVVAEMIVAAVRDMDGMRERGAKCVRLVREKFSLERMVEDYLRVYRAALTARPRDWSGIPARLRLSPVFSWRNYVAHRWGPGRRQYEASRRLAKRGDWALASVAARASASMSPTIYVRLERLTHLLKTQWRRRSGRIGK